MLSRMEFISIMVLKNRSEEIMNKFIELGVLHPVNISEIEEIGNFPLLKMESSSKLESIEERFKYISNEIKVPLKKEEEARKLSYDEIEEILNNTEEKLIPLIEEKKELLKEVEKKESFLMKAKEYKIFPIKMKSYYTFLELSLGKIKEKNFPLLEENLKEIPHISYPVKKEKKEFTILIIGLKKDRDKIRETLKDFEWKDIEYPEDIKEILPRLYEIQNEIKEYKEKIKNIDKRIKSLGENIKDSLSKVQSLILFKKSLAEAKKYAYSTEKTTIISGWIPEEEKDKITEEIKKNFSPYIEVKKPEELNISPDEVPVKIKQNAFFRLFQPLITSFGVPRYGTIDPTIFVAISFLIMFGIMFGDLGHGLTLSLMGIFLKREKKLKNMGTLIMYCGMSSSLFGILFGSFFGLEFHPVLFKPMNSIMEFIKLSIIFGIGIVTLGITINVINALKDRDYMKALFDKSGLISALIYWSGIGLIAKMSIYSAKISYVYLIPILSGLGILFIKPFIESIFRRGKESIINSLTKSTIDLLEIIMGYLSNTISFIRIAAFSLAHTGLFIAIFELSRIVGGILSMPIIILGNILIIGLEGLVVTIQALRLNYYEFFSKFFIGGKKIYEPLKYKEV